MPLDSKSRALTLLAVLPAAIPALASVMIPSSAHAVAGLSGDVCKGLLTGAAIGTQLSALILLAAKRKC